MLLYENATWNGSNGLVKIGCRLFIILFIFPYPHGKWSEKIKLVENSNVNSSPCSSATKGRKYILTVEENSVFCKLIRVSIRNKEGLFAVHPDNASMLCT